MLDENILRELSGNLKEPEWLLSKRLESFRQYSNLEAPSFKYGAGISLDTSGLDLNKVNPLGNLDESIIASSKEVEVMSFSEAFEKHSNLIKEYFMTKCNLSNIDKYIALHWAFFNNGILIRIPENIFSLKPIQINIDTNSGSRIEHTLIIAEKNSQASFIEVSKSSNKKEQVFRSQIVKLIIKENAKINYTSVQTLDSSTYDFRKRNAQLDKRSSINWIDCAIGGKFTQTFTTTSLNGSKAECKNFSCIFGNNEQCFDIKSTAIHSMPRTISNMITKVVLNDKAKAVYRGLIKINPNASNCEGCQKGDTILLSEHTQADIVPNLEISNNEVKCSHGATVSRIDEEKLFYMMSRGIDEKTAKKEIIEGFFNPLIEKISDNKTKEEIKDSISERLRVLTKNAD